MSEADPHLGRGPSVFICTSIGHVVDCRGGGQGTRGLWDKVILEGEGAYLARVKEEASLGTGEGNRLVPRRRKRDSTR